MTLEQIVDALRTRARFAPQFTAWHMVPEVPAQYEAYPSDLDPRLAVALQRRGIRQLYSHQAEAYRAVAHGDDVVVVTPTASGKTLCYNLPVVDAILKHGDTRALYLFPTKALSNDQVDELHGLVQALGVDLRTSTYDGVAIAWAVTECLHNQIGCKTIFATHYHELTQLTESLAHARNHNVAVREAGEEIVFLHRLEPGGADRSYGIHVGQLAGLPAPVVARAWQVLQLLEEEHHVAGRPVPPLPDKSQLGLFAGERGPHPLLDELSKIDVNTLSPLEALSRLAAMQRRLTEGG